MKRGISELELLFEEITKEELAKQQRKEHKKQKRKKKKEKRIEHEEKENNCEVCWLIFFPNIFFRDSFLTYKHENSEITALLVLSFFLELETEN